MSNLQQLLENNRKWAEQTESEQPGLLKKLSTGQSPRYMWIGCSDSRVPPELITSLSPGALFVHRNIANQAGPNDPGSQSAIQYAVDVLKVNHIIVCGHHGCGGVAAAMSNNTSGSIDEWLKPIRNICQANLKQLDNVDDPHTRLSELNVIAQVEAISNSEIAKAAWERGQSLAVHGWMYNLETGLLQDLDVSVSRLTEPG